MGTCSSLSAGAPPPPLSTSRANVECRAPPDPGTILAVLQQQRLLPKEAWCLTRHRLRATAIRVRVQEGMPPALLCSLLALPDVAALSVTGGAHRGRPLQLTSLLRSIQLRHFPGLRELTVLLGNWPWDSSWQERGAEVLDCAAELFSSLPPGLRALYTDVPLGALPIRVVLPLGLRDLRLRAFHASSFNVKHTFDTIEISYGGANFGVTLPESLKTLCLTGMRVPQGLALPPGLRHLQLHCGAPPAAEHTPEPATPSAEHSGACVTLPPLPQGLLSLRVRCTGHGDAVTLSIGDLPQTLRRLEIARSRGSFPVTLRMGALPPQLECVEIVNCRLARPL